jgi:hypothetical protein
VKIAKASGVVELEDEVLQFIEAANNVGKTILDTFTVVFLGSRPVR